MTDYKILIAEDNSDFVELLRERIKSFDSSIDVVETNNGYEALDKLREESFDLLITDFHMPIMNGMELVKSIKTISEASRPKNVIMLSAFLEPGEPSADLSFVRFLPKDDFKDSLFKLINDSKGEPRSIKLRRSSDRVALSAADNENIRIDIVGKNFVDIVKAKDISLGGIAVSVPHFIIDCKIGEVVDCVISLPHKKEIRTKGKIKHIGDKKDFYFGIEFLAMDKQSEINLRNFIELSH